ncbi:hypothetical protein DL93DRAFT_856368 [Clavulina sp. PMI_390]|nr:hypothetical protein DL93DRAFT_856368 [Clavulina sp. PMI_390]
MVYGDMTHEFGVDCRWSGDRHSVGDLALAAATDPMAALRLRLAVTFGRASLGIPSISAPFHEFSWSIACSTHNQVAVSMAIILIRALSHAKIRQTSSRFMSDPHESQPIHVGHSYIMITNTVGRGGVSFTEHSTITKR